MLTVPDSGINIDNPIKHGISFRIEIASVPENIGAKKKGCYHWHAVHSIFGWNVANQKERKEMLKHDIK